MSTVQKILSVDWGTSGIGSGLYYRLVDKDNNTLIDRTNSGVVEYPSGAGLYSTYVDFNVAWRGKVIWDDGTSYAQENIEVEDANIVSSTSSARNDLADSYLSRDWTAVSGSIAPRSALNAMRFLRNAWRIDGTTLQVTDETDNFSSPVWERTVETSNNAKPITGVD
jgi:hypothetical protein